MATASYERPRERRRYQPRRRGWLRRFVGWIFGTLRFLIATTIFFLLMSALGYLVVGQYIRGTEVQAPNVVARPLADALEAASRAHLTLIKDHSETHDTVPAGDVISQQPPPDSWIKTGTALRVVLSDGSPLMTVPELKGKSLIEAGVLLRTAGLEVGNQTDIPVAGVSGGILQLTDPPAGSGVAMGRRVNLLVSSGQAAAARTMPDLRGMSLADARAVLVGIGLRLPEGRPMPAEGVLPGQVHDQEPAPGATVGPSTPLVVIFAPQPSDQTDGRIGVGNEATGAGAGAAALGPAFGNATGR
jgi:eukaryotic-like serine/threonine-protein kinase